MTGRRHKHRLRPLDSHASEIRADADRQVTLSADSESLLTSASHFPSIHHHETILHQVTIWPGIFLTTAILFCDARSSTINLTQLSTVIPTHDEIQEDTGGVAY